MGEYIFQLLQLKTCKNYLSYKKNCNFALSDYSDFLFVFQHYKVITFSLIIESTKIIRQTHVKLVGLASSIWIGTAQHIGIQRLTYRQTVNSG